MGILEQLDLCQPTRFVPMPPVLDASTENHTRLRPTAVFSCSGVAGGATVQRQEHTMNRTGFRIATRAQRTPPANLLYSRGTKQTVPYTLRVFLAYSFCCERCNLIVSCHTYLRAVRMQRELPGGGRYFATGGYFHLQKRECCHNRAERYRRWCVQPRTHFHSPSVAYYRRRCCPGARGETEPGCRQRAHEKVDVGPAACAAAHTIAPLTPVFIHRSVTHTRQHLPRSWCCPSCGSTPSGGRRLSRESSRSVMLRPLVDVYERWCCWCRRRKKGQHPRRLVEVGRGDRGAGPRRAPPGSTLNEHEERTRSQRSDHHGIGGVTILTRSVQQQACALFLVCSWLELFREDAG